MKKLILLTLCCLSCLMAMSQTQQFFTSDKLSSNQVTSICQDKTGYIWVGTDYGLNKYDGYRFTNYLHETAHPHSISGNIISFLFCDVNNNLWVGTQLGLDRYNRDTDQFEHVKMEGAKAEPRINHIIQEDEEHLLIGTAGYGLYRLNIKTLATEKLEGFAKSDSDYFSHIMIDSEGAFWKSGYGNGINRRTPNGKIEEFESPYGSVTGFSEYEGGVLMACIHGLLYYRDGQMYDHYFDLSEIGDSEVFFRTAITDRHDNLFVGTIGSGLCWVPRGEHRLKRYEYQSALFDLNTSNVWALFEDNQNNLWVACQKRGLLMLPQQDPLFRSWKFADLHMATGGALTSVCEGENGITWCAVQNNGIFGLDERGRVVAHPASPEGTYLIYRDKSGRYWIGTNGALYAYNPLTGVSQKKTSFNNGFINTMTDDGKGHLIFSLYGAGFCCLDIATGEVKKYSMHDAELPRGRLHNDWIACLYTDSRGMIWICTASGINCFDPVEDHFHPYGWDVILDYNAVQTVCETRDHRFLIGTITGLYLYDSKQKAAVPFEGAEVLSNKVVGAIVEDRSGDFWCSTTMGIWQYKRDDQKFVGYLHGNGLASREYVNGVMMHTAGDRIWFGFSDGLTSFVPEDLRHYRPSQEKVQLTGLYVGDTLIMGSNRFVLSYIDNTFTMEFSLLNYSNAENVIYEYRLNGTKEWTRTAAGNNVVSFHHLQPGSYAMEVRAYDNGVYTEPQVYHIIIKAPWYQSSWAYLLYCALAAAIIGLIVWLYLRKRSQQLDEDKMKFLINATHDIRSPLTLIMSPLHKLLRKDLGEEVKEELKTIEHNASRIQNLVNQILDIRKIDKKQMKIHCQETDIVQYVGNILKSYEYTAHERGLSLTYKPAIDRLDVWLDRNQFDKVIDNLMSNAFKYTYDGGAIEVRVGQTDHSTAELKVIDNGMGIKGDLSKIFDRFYQGSTSRSLHIEGTGIGLNLCKMIMSMHHGHITAENRTDSSGSIFTVSLPLGNSHFTKEELEVVDPIIEKSPRTKPQTNYRILVVDDDEEIGKYIMSELGTYYRITAVTGAREALRYLLSAEPDRQFDLVVGDVMMPEMDGFTFLRMVKTNMNISHVPVVMLTSKADVANRLEGLEKGADAYLAKPFDMDELHVVINNLISKSLHLKGKFSGAQQQKEKVVAKEVKGNDELLMERIMKAVNTHLSDSDFNVDMLTREVGISRAQLHRKMKELTGLPVSEFIRNIRLEQAVRLLKEQKINVTQVAYSVGFSNVAHFSTVFRKQFGVSPSEYIEQHHSAETN